MGIFARINCSWRNLFHWYFKCFFCSDIHHHQIESWSVVRVCSLNGFSVKHSLTFNTSLIKFVLSDIVYSSCFLVLICYFTTWFKVKSSEWLNICDKLRGKNYWRSNADLSCLFRRWFTPSIPLMTGYLMTTLFCSWTWSSRIFENSLSEI